MLNKPQRLVRWAAGAYLLVLSYLILAPHPLWFGGDPGQQTEETVDSTMSGFMQHVLAYGLLACLLHLSLSPLTRRRIGAVLLIATSHALLLEGLQRFVPARYADWSDALANLVGIAVGTVLTTSGLLLVQSRQRPASSSNATSPAGDRSEAEDRSDRQLVSGEW